MEREVLESWASAYVDIQSDPMNANEHHPNWWAVERFMLPTDESVEDCWECILEILSRKPSDTVVAMLAAGPLEDIIHYHGEKLIDRIELEASQHPEFRRALQFIWQSRAPDIWDRLKRFID